MQTPTSNQGDRPPKRMRLGTKSCAECRRRKVRCIFSPGSRTCNSCSLHEAICTPQQPGGRHTPEESAQKKIDELQAIVSRICKAIDLDVESSTFADFEAGAARALERLGHGSPPESSVDGSSASASHNGSIDRRRQDDGRASSEELNSFNHAPLLNLFKEAMIIDPYSPASENEPQMVSADQKILACIKSLNALIPAPEGLEMILAATERYWFIWESFSDDFSIDRLAKFTRPGDTRVIAARKWIFESMSSGNSVMVAKAVIHLAMCVQQLPFNFDIRGANLSAPPQSLLLSYIDGAETLVSSDSSPGSLDVVECFFLLAKLYINLGKPRKAWLVGRRASNLAILYGYHRPEAKDARETSKWDQLWQGDRMLSMSLGVPYAVQNPPPCHADANFGERFHHGLAIAAGHIIDRDQLGPAADYSVTAKIDEELEYCRSDAPPGWWDMIPDPGMPLDLLYGHLVTKIHWHLTRKLLHLPYMLKSLTDNRYEKSQVAALESAMEILVCYQAFRNNGGDAVVVCDLIDFQSFSAALTIIIYLLSPLAVRAHSQTICNHNAWDVIRQVTATLKRVSKLLECHVAGQASHLLEYLTAVHDGTTINTGGYEAMVPYFGRIRITGVKGPKMEKELEQNGNLYAQDFSWFPGAVEFSSNTFGDSFTGNYLSEAELGVDWTALFEMDGNFDWTQTYESPHSW